MPKYECIAKIVSSVRMETIADSPEDAERLFKRKQANLLDREGEEVFIQEVREIPYD